jgi:hypothetical protein
MQFYREINADCDPVSVYQFSETLANAHVSLKAYDLHYLPSLRIELVEVPTDKSSICRMLNNDAPELVALRTWCLTPRGGLKEINNGE